MAFDAGRTGETADSRYYRGQVSVINNDLSPQRKGRHGQPFKTVERRPLDNTNLTADGRYYANPDTQRGAAKAKPVAGTATVSLISEAKDTAAAIMSRVKQQLQRTPDSRLDVTVAASQEDALRVLLDLAESREQITPAQRSAVTLRPFAPPQMPVVLDPSPIVHPSVFAAIKADETKPAVADPVAAVVEPEDDEDESPADAPVEDEDEDDDEEDADEDEDDEDADEDEAEDEDEDEAVGNR